MSKKLYTLISIVLICFFVSSRTLFFKQSFLENIFSQVTYPILVITSTITNPVKAHFLNKESVKLLRTKVKALSLNNEALISENIKLKAILNHQEATRELIDFQSRYELENGIFTKVLIKNLTPASHYYIINRGSSDGVKKDMVMIYKFQLVGRVDTVYAKHSKVRLITDINSKVAVYANATNARGIVLGQNKPNVCKLAYVSHLSKVENDDFVLSSGQGLVFPEGFCLGKIISSDVADFVHNIEIESIVDLTKINFGILLDRKQIINF